MVRHPAMKLNSIIFHTQRLPEVRQFYREQLGLEVGTFKKDGQTLADESESYVNFIVGDSLLCFEVGSEAPELGSIVLNVSNFDFLKSKFKALVVREGAFWFKIKDPEGRSLLIERNPEVPSSALKA